MSASSRETSTRRAWPSRMITTAQTIIGAVALLGVAAWVTLNPILLLLFLFAQPALLVGIALFVVAALASLASGSATAASGANAARPEALSHRPAIS
jgi:hypothetical protein